LRDKERINQKNSKILIAGIVENSARTLKKLVEVLNVGESTISDRWEGLKKECKRISHELSIQNCLTIRTSLFSQHKKM